MTLPCDQIFFFILALPNGGSKFLVTPKMAGNCGPTVEMVHNNLESFAAISLAETLTELSDRGLPLDFEEVVQLRELPSQT